MSVSQQGDDGRKLLEAIGKYTDLLRSGKRMPASEYEVWLAGYNFRKKNSQLTPLDVERMDKLRYLSEQPYFNRLFGLIICFSAFLFALFAVHWSAVLWALFLVLSIVFLVLAYIAKKGHLEAQNHLKDVFPAELVGSTL